MNKIILILCILGFITTVQAGDFEFRRGDCNENSFVDPSDADLLFCVLFSEACSLNDIPCQDACDADDTGTLNITDPIYILLYLFNDGFPPPPPGPNNCGLDFSEDNLTCDLYLACPL